MVSVCGRGRCSRSAAAACGSSPPAEKSAGAGLGAREPDQAAGSGPARDGSVLRGREAAVPGQRAPRAAGSSTTRVSPPTTRSPAPAATSPSTPSPSRRRSPPASADRRAAARRRPSSTRRSRSPRTSSGTAARSSLEDQALGPIANPIEMGNTHEAMIATLSRVQGYRPYFKEAFGTEEITKERVAQAIADYERTRVSGNSPYDRWRFNHEQDAVSAAAKRGHDLFFDTAGCVQCHTGQQLQRQPVSQHSASAGIRRRRRSRTRGASRSRRSPRTAARSRRRCCATSASTRPTCTTARLRRCAKWSSCTTRAASRTRI